VIILASPNTLGHSPKARLVVTITEARSQTRLRIERKLSAGLGKGQISEFVQNDEVHLGQMLGEPPLRPVAGLDFEAVDKVDQVVEAPTAPDRMRLLAIAMARWVLPVPVPPTSTTLRCWAMKPPAVWCGQFTRHPGRTSSPQRPCLSFRYTQAVVATDDSAAIRWA